MPNKIQLRKFKCPICGMRDDFPADSKPEDIINGCGVCFQHRWHEDGKINPFCCVCRARAMKAKLRALWTLFVNWENLL